MKLALAQYPIGKFASLADWQAHVGDWVARAAKDGANFCPFPNMAGWS